MYLDFLQIKNDYIKASKRAFACGLAAATGGNISVRITEEDKMLVKPTGITLGEVSEENLIVTDFWGKLEEGNKKPTKETILHGGLYRNFPEIRGIVHVHPVYSIICANSINALPLVTKQMKQIMDIPVPVCKIKSLTVDEKGMEEIYALMKEYPGLPCFLLEEHGVVAVGKSAEEAEYIAELIEENAKVYWKMNYK